MNPNDPRPKRPLENLTAEEARTIVREAVKETFLMLGLKIDDPIEVQKDFQHLREWRETTEALKSKGMLAVTGVIFTGLLGALWVGIKDLINK